jgi:hypothetical protein
LKAQQTVSEESNKNKNNNTKDPDSTDQQQQQQRDRHRREETRDWSNFSNIKALKNRTATTQMEKEQSRLTNKSSGAGGANGENDPDQSRNIRPKSIHSKQSVLFNNTSGESSPESDAEDEFAERGRQDQSDLPSEYWQIQKLVKYLKVIFFIE